MITALLLFLRARQAVREKLEQDRRERLSRSLQSNPALITPSTSTESGKLYKCSLCDPVSDLCCLFLSCRCASEEQWRKFFCSVQPGVSGCICAVSYTLASAHLLSLLFSCGMDTGNVVCRSSSLEEAAPFCHFLPQTVSPLSGR